MDVPQDDNRPRFLPQSKSEKLFLSLHDVTKDAVAALRSFRSVFVGNTAELLQLLIETAHKHGTREIPCQVEFLKRHGWDFSKQTDDLRSLESYHFITIKRVRGRRVVVVHLDEACDWGHVFDSFLHIVWSMEREFKKREGDSA